MTYLDHAATTPVLPEVIAAMSQAMTLTGNASSLHTSGRAARRRVEESRERIADALGARPSEIVFTSGGTESDNLAITGMFRARMAADPLRRRILAPVTEHPAVLDVVEHLALDEGATVTWLEVDDFGRVHADTLAAAIAENPADVALVTVMWANNEVGTVNPVRELAEVAHHHGIPFHTDAVQALGQLPVDFTLCGADALTVTGHKVGGPSGAGLLVLRRDAPVAVDRKLIYILAHKNAAAGAASFDAFRKDPDWVKARAESEKKAGGSLTEGGMAGVKSTYMQATDYSPMK